MNLFNRTGLIVLLAFILLLAGLVYINYLEIEIPYLSWVQGGVYNLVSPLIEYANRLYRSVKSVWIGIFKSQQIVKENESLREEITMLKRENLLYRHFQRENKRLRELLAFKQYVDYQTIGAFVVGNSPSLWNNVIIIDRGSSDGIEEKMPVISYNGSLVGRIEYVGVSTSQVRLISDPEFVVGGIVEREDSRAIGLVKGQLNEDKVNIMEKISWDADIEEEDLILTSGLSNSYPRGLPIGKVIEIESENYGLSLKAEVNLFAALKTIEEVLVITDF